MSNRNERNRVKNLKRIQKLLGNDFHINSDRGGFAAYRFNPNNKDEAIYVHLRPMGTEWIISSPDLGIDWQGTPLRVGVNLVRATCLLVA